MNKVQARITVLSAEQIEQVHKNTLKVLSSTGIRVDSAKARKVFSDALGKPIDSEFVRIPPDLVEYALKSAPSSVEIFDRKGNPAFYLSNKQETTYFGIGVTNLWYQDPETDHVVPFTRKHIGISCLLGQALKSYNVISTPGVIQNSDTKIVEVIAALEMIANSTKPLVVLVSNMQQFEIVLKMLQHLHGDLSAHPFIIPYFNPVTPFVLNEETTDKMFLTIENGLPFIFSNYGMSGATTPITAGGTLVTLNAELLAGLVFAQLVKKGSPMILGSLPSVFEMKNMFSAYTSQTMLLNLACAEMMNYYKIPHCGTSGSGSGWGPDLLASGTLWMNHLTSCLGKVSLAPFVGGNFDSLVFSPVTVIYSDEVIRQARMFAEGFALDNKSIALDSINSVGPGGNFLMADQTLALYREVHEQHSHIWPGFSLDKWMDEKYPKAIDHLRKHSLDILNNLAPPEDHDELISKGETFLENIKT